MGACVGWTILSIVAEKMTPKALHQRASGSGSKGVWAREYVTVENPPIPFSPFSLADCTMLSHFSFDDFIAIAFPDIAGDLDIQI